MGNLKITKEYWFVIISGLLSGLVVFSGQIFANNGLSLFEISTLPFLGSVIILIPFILFKKKHRYTGKNLPALLLYGAVSLLLTVAQFAPLLLGVPVAIAVLLLYTQPLWTVLFSYTILKEKINKTEIIACLIVLIGVLILINPFKESGHIPILGLVVALIGGVLLSGWVSVGSYLSKKGNDPINSLFTEKIFSIVVLLALFPLFKLVVKNPHLIHFSLNWPIKVWLGLLLFSIVIQILNHWFYLSGTKKVPTIDAGIIMLLEPVIGALLAMTFLRQPLTIGVVIGGILIIFANYLVISNNGEVRT